MGSGLTVSQCAAERWAWRPDISGTAQVWTRLTDVALGVALFCREQQAVDISGGSVGDHESWMCVCVIIFDKPHLTVFISKWGLLSFHLVGSVISTWVATVSWLMDNLIGRKLICSYFDSQEIFWVIFLKKKCQTNWLQHLRCERFLVPSVFFDSKLDMFDFSLSLTSDLAFFIIFWYLIDKTVNQQINR